MNKKRLIQILIPVGIILLIGLVFWVYNKQEKYIISVTSINKGLTTLSVNSLIASRPSILYAGTEDGGVFKSIDRGENWFLINKGLGDFNKIKKLQYFTDIEGNDIVYLLTAGLLFRSENGGLEWELVTPYFCIQNDKKIRFPSFNNFLISDVGWESAVYGLTFIIPKELDEGISYKMYVTNSKFLRGCGKDDYLCQEKLCEDWFSSSHFPYSYSSDTPRLDAISLLDEYDGTILGRSFSTFYISQWGRNWDELNFNEFGKNVEILDLKAPVWYSEDYKKYLYASIKTESGNLFLESKDYGGTWKKLSEGKEIPEIFITHCDTDCYITGFTKEGYLVRSTGEGKGKNWKVSVNHLPEEVISWAWSTNLPLSRFFSETFIPDPELENVLYIGTRSRGVLRIEIGVRK